MQTSIVTTQRQIYDKILELIKETCFKDKEQFIPSNAILAFLRDSDFFETLLLVKANEIQTIPGFVYKENLKLGITRPLTVDFPIVQFSDNVFSDHRWCVSIVNQPSDYLEIPSSDVVTDYYCLSADSVALLGKVLHEKYCDDNYTVCCINYYRSTSIVRISLQTLLEKILPDSKDIIKHLFKNLMALYLYDQSTATQMSENVLRRTFSILALNYKVSVTLKGAWERFVYKCFTSSANMEGINSFMKTFVPIPLRGASENKTALAPEGKKISIITYSSSAFALIQARRGRKRNAAMRIGEYSEQRELNKVAKLKATSTPGSISTSSTSEPKIPEISDWQPDELDEKSLFPPLNF